MCLTSRGNINSNDTQFYFNHKCRVPIFTRLEKKTFQAFIDIPPFLQILIKVCIALTKSLDYIYFHRGYKWLV